MGLLLCVCVGGGVVKLYVRCKRREMLLSLKGQEILISCKWTELCFFFVIYSYVTRRQTAVTIRLTKFEVFTADWYIKAVISCDIRKKYSWLHKLLLLPCFMSSSWPLVGLAFNRPALVWWRHKSHPKFWNSESLATNTSDVVLRFWQNWIFKILLNSLQLYEKNPSVLLALPSHHVGTTFPLCWHYVPIMLALPSH